MVQIFAKCIRLGILFTRATLGVINSPYVTYRRLAARPAAVGQVVFLYLFAILYFLFVTLIRSDTRNPFLLTIKLNFLLMGAGGGIFLLFGVMYGALRWMRIKGSFQTLFVLYSYSLLPTIIWFFTTSLLYLFLPPPRTASIFGKILSIVYIAFSIALFIWKCILYYLSLRFPFRLSITTFIRVSLVTIPTVLMYALLMYRLGIFRIPFL